MTIMHPPVGYPGAKRRLVPRLLPFFPLSRMRLYVEPFIGMGSLYINLRARGYRYPAVLAEANDALRDFWTFVHDRKSAIALVRACDALPTYASPEDYWRIARDGPPPADPIERAAHWLWLTRFSFCNQPPHHGKKSNSWEELGTRAESTLEASWAGSVDKLEHVIKVCAGKPILVLDDAYDALERHVVDRDAYVYADPPYRGTMGYNGGNDAKAWIDEHNYISPVVRAAERATRVVLSEGSPIDSLDEHPDWRLETIMLPRNAAGGKGTKGTRAEYLYTTPRD